MPAEQESAHPIELPDEKETLKKIYQEGFDVGDAGGRPETNPYAFKKHPQNPPPLSYALEWERGREDGHDLNPKISKLSPNLQEEKRKKLSQNLNE